VTDGQASISAEILARYASDAACEVDGVRGISGRRGSVLRDDGRVELRLEIAWGAAIPTLGRRVQERVRRYLKRMADLEPAAIDVVVERIGPLR